MSEAVGHEGVADWLVGLRGSLGEAQVADAPEAQVAHALDGHTPRAVVTPQSVEQLAEVLRLAGANRLAVTPWGGGTKQGLGRPLTRLDLVLKTGGLARILELDEGNLTAEVEAGMSLGALQAELAQRRLFFALDPLEGEQATLGGIIATNASGPKRLYYRTARDHVLGMRVALPDGRLLRTGGKTVKDVAGYNLTKPLIGSWGTAGVVVSATIRLQPAPEDSATVVAAFPAVAPAAALALKVRGTFLLPTAMELVSQGAWQVAGGGSLAGNGATLAFLLEGAREAVARHERDLTALAQGAGAVMVATLRGDDMAAAWRQRQRVAGALQAAFAGLARAKVGVPLSALGTILAVAESEGAKRGLGLAFAAHAGNGLAQVYFVGGEDVMRDALLSLRQAATNLGGYLLLETASLSLKQKVGVLPARDDYDIMRQLKASLNPGDSLNPGKLV